MFGIPVIDKEALNKSRFGGFATMFFGALEAIAGAVCIATGNLALQFIGLMVVMRGVLFIYKNKGVIFGEERGEEGGGSAGLRPESTASPVGVENSEPVSSSAVVQPQEAQGGS